MKIIGITGGIGVGKSYVLNILKKNFDFNIIETDKIGHDLLMKNSLAFDEILNCFGDKILDTSKDIDRKKLGEIVFSSEEKLIKLNNIVHPLIKKTIINDIKNIKNSNYYFIEGALLIQDNYDEICNEYWTIISNLETRIKRLVENRKITKENANLIISKQPSEDFYTSKSKHIIYNYSDEDSIIKQVEEILYK